MIMIYYLLINYTQSHKIWNDENLILNSLNICTLENIVQ